MKTEQPTKFADLSEEQQQEVIKLVGHFQTKGSEILRQCIGLLDEFLFLEAHVEETYRECNLTNAVISDFCDNTETGKGLMQVGSSGIHTDTINLVEKLMKSSYMTPTITNAVNTAILQRLYGG